MPVRKLDLGMLECLREQAGVGAIVRRIRDEINGLYSSSPLNSESVPKPRLQDLRQW